jgi:serine/threonine protein kinase
VAVLLSDETLGHYRIIAKIGEGGMGSVYRAHDEALDRDVALKVLPDTYLSTSADRKRLHKEGLALAKLNHPNIATVFEFGSQDEVDYLVMELVPGESLEKILAKGPLRAGDIARVGIMLADGLAEAHKHNVIHRDLKPANLMITPDGRVKILDFGLAKLLQPENGPAATSASFQKDFVVGTLDYMSPEQLKSQPVDARSDIYAAGAVLYEMATGRKLFAYEHAAELVGAILHVAPAKPSSLNPRINHKLEAVILKALEKDPERRFQSAGEFRVALEPIRVEFENNTSIRWRRGARLDAVLALIALAALAIAFNVAGIRDRIIHGASQPNPVPEGDRPIPMRLSPKPVGLSTLPIEPDRKSVVAYEKPQETAVESRRGPIFADFSGPTIQSNKVKISPGTDFSYNGNFGASWRIVAPGGGFTAAFVARRERKYDLSVTHLSSMSPQCPGRGYSPVTIQLNSAAVVADYDPSADHQALHAMVTDNWPVIARRGLNTLQWSAGALCSHYWIQRIELKPAAPTDNSVMIAVTASKAWTDTGVNLERWQLFTVNASGTMTFYYGDRVGGGPEGTVEDCTHIPHQLEFIATNLSCHSLIGRIGLSGEIFEVGSGGTFTADRAGRLWLGVNDNQFGDNSGSWTAKIKLSEK